MISSGSAFRRTATRRPSVLVGIVSFGAAILASLLVVAQIASAANGPTAPNGASQPLPVQSASLSQNGQQIVWQLKMAQPFSPGALTRDRRTLCLLIARVDNGTVTGQLCVAGPRQGQRAPQVLYAPVSKGVSGRASAIAATVTRGSNSDLTASFAPSAIAAAYQPLRWQVISTLGSPLCSAPATGIPPAGSCQTLFPARPALLTLRTPQLAGCVPTKRGYVSQGPSNVRQVALTFDDGPGGSPPTIDFVNLLARYHVPATFFEVGNQISQYDPTGKVQREMLADGDMIGDHSWSHADLAKLSASAQRSQIAMTAAAIKKATGFQPCLFRAPYGSVNSSLINVASSLGFSTIQWDVDPRDWSLPGTSAIISRVLAGVRPGSIVLQHNAGGPRYQTLAALPTEISTLKARGYKFVTVTQMLGYKLIYK
jgi:peptidoglycan/xylan/chitin deacetylase (PgdA/CDA1 family)